MCITAHFITTEWKLIKKVIAFVPVSSHRGEYIAKALETSLVEWGLKNVFTVTLDNASSNDTAMSFFKKKLISWGASPARVKYLHMRCVAHILNLVVSDGLKEINVSVKRIRELVRYIRNSPARITKFREFSDLIGIESKCGLCIDVPTRWNSTFLMLRNACQFDKTFEKYEECEPALRADLGDDVPEFFDWQCAKNLLKLLEHFFNMTLRTSGSQYVTSNTFFSEISDLFVLLTDWIKSDDLYVRFMGANMKLKFDKYWGDADKINILIFIANILYPRDKMVYLEFSCKTIYGEQLGVDLFQRIKRALYELFDAYNTAAQASCSSSVLSGGGSQSDVQVQSSTKSSSLLKARFLQQQMDIGIGGSKRKSELDLYLSESNLEETDDGRFDLLRWWKLNSERLPVLSSMARDVLAIPMSTVASESAFSTSGRVLDCFRSCLTHSLVQALICTQDWLKNPNKTMSVEENLEEWEEFEKGTHFPIKFNII